MGLIRTRKNQNKTIVKTRIGIDKGKREAALTMAVELKRRGLTVEDIAKGTGLSIELIETL